jgi:hypothetical protein
MAKEEMRERKVWRDWRIWRAGDRQKFTPRIQDSHGLIIASSNPGTAIRVHPRFARVASFPQIFPVVATIPTWRGAHDFLSSVGLLTLPLLTGFEVSSSPVSSCLCQVCGVDPGHKLLVSSVRS